jgi:hypothetical protein
MCIVQCTLTIGSRIRNYAVLYTLTKPKISGVFFVVHGAFANNLLPHAQGMLTIRYRMRRVR